MSERCVKQSSPRHGFVFSETPTVKGSIWGGSCVKHYPDSYALILDCVYEMTDQVSSSNGVSHEQAIESVLKDEGWRLLPKHKKVILQKLMEAV